MSLHYPKPTHNDSSNYLVSGIPYVLSSISAPVNTGTPIAVSFPYVTQRIWVDCTSGSVRVGFSSNGVSNTPATKNYYVLAASSPNLELRVRVGQLFVLSNAGTTSQFSVIAELTPAPGDQIAGGILKNWSGSAGIG